MKKNDMLLIGGLAIAGIAALFLFKGSDQMTPSGGSGYGGSYTGGEAGGLGDLEDILKFGGETVNFPAPEQLDISKFLQTPEELADDGTKKSTTIAATPSVAIIGQTHPVSPATMTPVKIIGQTSHSGSKSKYNQAQPGAPGSGYVVRGYSLTGKPLYKPG